MGVTSINIIVYIPCSQGGPCGSGTVGYVWDSMFDLRVGVMWIISLPLILVKGSFIVNSLVAFL